VFGKLFPAAKSLSLGGLPLGLATMKLIRPVAKGKSLSWGDVAMDESLPAYKVRKEMEGLFTKAGVAGAK
jgi:predicted homoserine dehydrogenase-like protein